MKAGLPAQEPKLLERWERIGLWRRLREDSAARELFVLHDGPPYANGHIHIGTALNKILKDVVNRSQQMTGKNANYVPGWDCHGLPIEWQVEQRYRDAGATRTGADPWSFAARMPRVRRALDRRAAQGVHPPRLRRRLEQPYANHDNESEAQIVREICSFLMNGGLYKGAKPVMWSVVEKTALAEAEIEYMDHTSTTVSVRFPVLDGNTGISGASIVIWTTTPWTLPGNRAIAVKPDADYVRFASTRSMPTRWPGSARRSFSRGRSPKPCAGRPHRRPRGHRRVQGRAARRRALRPSPARRGYDFDVAVLPAGFVDMEQGTGFVHVAPVMAPKISSSARATASRCRAPSTTTAATTRKSRFSPACTYSRSMARSPPR